jgi:hypothetical protein
VLKANSNDKGNIGGAKPYVDKAPSSLRRLLRASHTAALAPDLPRDLSSSDAATKAPSALFQIDRYILFIFFPVQYCVYSPSPFFRITTHIRRKGIVGIELIYCG